MTAPQDIPKPKLKFWWIMMGVSTVISIFLNIWHSQTVKVDPKLIADACAVSADLCKEATELGNQVVGIHPLLGVIFALVPPGFAAMLSHGLISELVGKWIKRGILALFGVSIATSVVSQAAVMRPYGGGWAEWTIPLVLDSAALISLHIITITIADYRRKINSAEAEAERISVKAEIRAVLEAEARAEIRAEAEAEIRPVIEAEAARKREAEITAARAEGRAEAEAEIPALIEAAEAEARTRAEVETAARLRLERTAGKGGGKSPAKAATAIPTDPDKRRLSSKDEAIILYQQNPEISGGELGKALNLTDTRGRQLLREIKAELAQIPPDAGPRPPLRSVS